MPFDHYVGRAAAISVKEQGQFSDRKLIDGSVSRLSVGTFV